MTPVKFPTHSCLFSQILLVHKTKSINLAFCKQNLKYLITQNTQDTNEHPSAITTHCRHTQRSSVVHLRQAGICNSICDQCRTGGERWKYTAVFYKEATLRLFQTLKNTSNYWPSQGNKLRPMVSWVTFFGGGGIQQQKHFFPLLFFFHVTTVTLKLHSRYCRLWDNNQFSQSGLRHCQNPETTSKKCSATSACFPWSHHLVRSRSVSSKD